MDNSSKKIVLAFSVLPILTWVATLAYFLYINDGLIATRTFQNHDAVITNIINHFLPFTILLSFAELVTGLMICYYVVHIARLKTLDAFQKMGYIIFLVFLGPIAVLVTWFIEVRKEPLNIEMYPNVG